MKYQIPFAFIFQDRIQRSIFPLILQLHVEDIRKEGAEHGIRLWCLGAHE